MLLDSMRNIVGQPNVKLSLAILEDVDAVSCRHAARRNWLRGRDLNPRSRSCGIMCLFVLYRSTGKTRRLLFAS
jgi:hypothetical protein